MQDSIGLIAGLMAEFWYVVLIFRCVFPEHWGALVPPFIFVVWFEDHEIVAGCRYVSGPQCSIGGQRWSFRKYVCEIIRLPCKKSWNFVIMKSQCLRSSLLPQAFRLCDNLTDVCWHTMQAGSTHNLYGTASFAPLGRTGLIPLIRLFSTLSWALEYGLSVRWVRRS